MPEYGKNQSTTETENQTFSFLTNGAPKMRCIHATLVAISFLTLTTLSALADDNASEPSGQAVFETSCANCHTGGFGGFFTSAPDIDDPDDWEASVPKGVEGLTATTIAGFGEMEPRGGCATCTDEEIRAAIEYMLEVIQ
jgi:cytochrome c5